MKKKNYEQRRAELLRNISSIPKRMIQVNGKENMSELLLHNLSEKNCFNFAKSAIFIDNPDFDHLKGIAGFQSTNSYQSHDVWNKPDEFTTYMKEHAFNQRVRSIGKQSIKKNNLSEKALFSVISQELELENPSYHTWPLKHDNHGFLIFELSDSAETDLIEDHLEESLYLFGFCPVF